MSFRLKKPNIKVVGITIILFLILISFILSGVTSYFVDKTQTVATIGDKEISSQELNFALSQKKQAILASKSGPAVEALINSTQFSDIILNDLIRKALISQELESLGVVVTRSSVKQFILQSGIFRNGEKTFDPMTFKQYLFQTGQDEDEFILSQIKNFESRIFEDYLSILQYKDLTSLATNLAKTKSRKYDILFKSFEPKHLSNNEKNYTEEELLSFYNENKNNFIEPESREIVYFDVSKYIDKTSQYSIPESEIMNVYSQNYLKNGKTQKLEDVKETIKKDLLKRKRCSIISAFVDGIDSQINTGKSVKEIITAISETELKQITISKNFDPEKHGINFDLTQKFIATNDTNYGEIFRLKSEEDSCHYFVYQAQKIQKERIKSFDEVRGLVISSFLAKKALAAAKEEASKFAFEISEKQNFSEMQKVQISFDTTDFDKNIIHTIFNSKPQIVHEPIFDSKTNSYIVFKTESFTQNQEPTQSEIEKVKKSISEYTKEELNREYFDYLNIKFNVKKYIAQEEK